MAASNRGHYEAVDFLLQRGANPNMQDNVRSRKIEMTLNLPVPVCVCSVSYLSVCIYLSLPFSDWLVCAVGCSVHGTC